MKNIVLVGFMATGKTTIAKELARRMQCTYVSLDELIEKKENRSIAQIFAEDGEDYFRKIEAEVVREVSDKENLIIDTGGGVVLREENIENLKKKGILICLKAKPEVILERIKGYTHRPLLNVSNPQQRIIELLKIREPFYLRADYFIDTSDISILEAVEKILGIIPEINL